MHPFIHADGWHQGEHLWLCMLQEEQPAPAGPAGAELAATPAGAEPAATPAAASAPASTPAAPGAPVHPARPSEQPEEDGAEAMDEDEALQRALQMSIDDEQPPNQVKIVSFSVQPVEIKLP